MTIVRFPFISQNPPSPMNSCHEECSLYVLWLECVCVFICCVHFHDWWLHNHQSITAQYYVYVCVLCVTQEKTELMNTLNAPHPHNNSRPAAIHPNPIVCLVLVIRLCPRSPLLRCARIQWANVKIELSEPRAQLVWWLLIFLLLYIFLIFEHFKGIRRYTFKIRCRAHD